MPTDTFLLPRLQMKSKELEMETENMGNGGQEGLPATNEKSVGQFAGYGLFLQIF